MLKRDDDLLDDGDGDDDKYDNNNNNDDDDNNNSNIWRLNLKSNINKHNETDKRQKRRRFKEEAEGRGWKLK